MVENGSNSSKLEKKLVGEWSNMIGPTIVAKDGSLRGFLEETFMRFKVSHSPQLGMEYFFSSKTGFPSPIIRIDMPLITERVSPIQGFFEIEARPAGLGVDSALFPEHRDAFAQYIDQLRSALNLPLAIKMFPYSQNPRHDPGGEKKAFAELVGIPFFGVGQEPDVLEDFYYFVYGNTGEVSDLERFEGRSLFPVRDDGNKNYLVEMGAAQPADRVKVSQKLGLGVPFVLKPRKGMWAQDVTVYPGDTVKHRFTGFASEDDVHELLAGPEFNDRYLCQSFFSPGQIRLGRDSYLAMARVYAFANLETGRYDVSNGIYMARQNIRLHGTADAITGQLLLK